MRWIKANRLLSKANHFNLSFWGFKFLLFQICVKLEKVWQYFQAPERKWCTAAMGQEAVPGSHSYLGTDWGRSRTLAPNITAIWTGKNETKSKRQQICENLKFLSNNLKLGRYIFKKAPKPTTNQKQPDKKSAYFYYVFLEKMLFNMNVQIHFWINFSTYI